MWQNGPVVEAGQSASRDQPAAPDPTAVRVALWRALHVELDPPPHVLHDLVGLSLAAPEEGWRRRPDMDPLATRLFRPSIVARARFIEDLVLEQAQRGVQQYVILGAGLDTFAQRRPALAAGLRDIRGRPAGPAGLEAPAPRRARPCPPRRAAVRGGRLRGGPVVARSADRRRLRPRAACRRRLDRRLDVSHPRGQCRDVAPDGGASRRARRSP